MHVRLEGVTHAYETSAEAAAVQVLDNVTLDIPSGRFAILRGASGSGKSTLLNLIGAIDRPTRGKVFLDDVETSALTETQLTHIRRSRVGFIFQFFNLVPTLTVFENVALPLSIVGERKDEIERRVSATLDEIGLTHRAHRFPNELSGGEMQRAAIGRAIVHRPQLLLADEPTGNLDSQNGAAVLDLIAAVHRAVRPTVIMATHSDRAATFGEVVIEVADGRVRAGAARE